MPARSIADAGPWVTRDDSSCMLAAPASPARCETMNRLLLPVLAALLISSPAHALEFFKADIEANGSTGSSASGVGSFVFDEGAGELTYEISVEGLGTPEIGAHIHAPEGSILLQLPHGPTKNGVLANIGPAQAFQLRFGLLFVLIHSEEFPCGDVRGDIVAGMVPVESPSVGELKRRFVRQ